MMVYNLAHSEMNGGVGYAELDQKTNLAGNNCFGSIRLPSGPVFVFGSRSSRNSGRQS